MYFKDKWHYYIMITWAVIWYTALCMVRTFSLSRPDTSTYQISSIGELSWIHRMPGYQLISLFFYNLGGGSYENADKYIIIFQICMAIIGSLFLYDALLKYLHSIKWALFFGNCNMMIIAMFGYSDVLLTESLAVSVMCILIWIMVQAVETRKSRYFVLLSVLSFCGTMIRPSFIFSFPCLMIFFVCFYIADDRKIAFKGLLSLFIVTLIIIAYCKHNESLMGRFCLSDVSYNSELSCLITGDMYDNPKYPEITEFIRHELEDEDTNSLRKAKNTFHYFGYDVVVDYIKDSQRLYGIKYINSIKNTVLGTMNQPIVENASEIGQRGRMVYEALRVILLPWSFASLLFWTLGYLGYIIYCSIKEKRFYYVDFGIVACILSIYILSSIMLYEATLQRIAICVIPCTVFLEALIIKHFTEH